MDDKYLHDFSARISDQSGKVNSQYEQYAADKQSAQDQRQAYQDAFKNQSAYGDLLKAAEEEKGVGAARDTYNQSMRAIAATNQAMNALPSTINANSERVLTQAQRNAALGNQMSKYQNTLSSWQQQNATDAAMYQALANEAQNLAGNQLSQEQYNLGMQQSDWQTLLNQAAQTYNQAVNEQNIRNAIYQQMYEDEANHRQMEYNYWAKQLDDENAKRQLALQEAANASQRNYYDYLMSQDQANNQAQQVANEVANINAGSTADTSTDNSNIWKKIGSVLSNPLVAHVTGYGVTGVPGIAMNLLGKKMNWW